MRIAVDVDGLAWQVDVDRFRADRRKLNALVAAGRLVLRFTWHDLATGRTTCSRRSAQHCSGGHDQRRSAIRTQL
ncbi:MAG: hypothetical protein AB7J32_11545 [Pseudonocardia sp.]